MGWAGDETGTVSAGGEGPKAGPRYYCMHVLRTYVPHRATVPCMVARAAPGGGQTGRVGQASSEEEAGVWAGVGVVAEIVGGLGGWMDGARVAGGRARGGMGGVDGTKWHLLRSCPLAPSCQGQGSQFAFTGGQRPWWSLVSSGLSVAASFASLPRRLAQSLNLRALSIGPAGIRGGRGVGTRTTLGPLVQVELRPGLGRGGEVRGGVGVGKIKKRETAAGSEYFAVYAVHCTMHHAGSTYGDAGLLWARMWVMWVLRWDHHPFAIPAPARRNPYLIACIDPVSPTSAEKGSARGQRWINLILAVVFMCTWRPQYMSLVSPLNIAIACGMPAGNRVATRQTSGLSVLLQGTRRN